MPEKAEQGGARPVSSWLADLRSVVPNLVLTGLVAFAASWWSTKVNESRTEFRLDAVEKRVETVATQVTQNSIALQQNAIRIAEVSRDQLNLTEQLKDVKLEVQTRIK